jgi:hypothetical protein
MEVIDRWRRVWKVEYYGPPQNTESVTEEAHNSPDLPLDEDKHEDGEDDKSPSITVAAEDVEETVHTPEATPSCAEDVEETVITPEAIPSCADDNDCNATKAACPQWGGECLCHLSTPKQVEAVQEDGGFLVRSPSPPDPQRVHLAWAESPSSAMPDSGNTAGPQTSKPLTTGEVLAQETADGVKITFSLTIPK